jgi:hypothetical protein
MQQFIYLLSENTNYGLVIAEKGDAETIPVRMRNVKYTRI